jgi:stage V sporulation protein AC
VELSRQQRQKLTPAQRHYLRLAEQYEPKRRIVKNVLLAFCGGGLICAIGQLIQLGFIYWGGFSAKTASNPTVAVLILISVLLTTFGVYDKWAQIVGAGSSVPVTGFANALSSAALEHRSEGLVLGVGGQMFKVAGPVIVFGTVAAFVVAILRVLISPWFT